MSRVTKHYVMSIALAFLKIYMTGEGNMTLWQIIVWESFSTSFPRKLSTKYRIKPAVPELHYTSGCKITGCHFLTMDRQIICCKGGKNWLFILWWLTLQLCSQPPPTLQNKSPQLFHAAAVPTRVTRTRRGIVLNSQVATKVGPWVSLGHLCYESYLWDQTTPKNGPPSFYD